MAGRKKLPVVPKSKKIKLSKAQKQYAKMIHSIEADLTKKQAAIEALDKKLGALTAERQKLDSERQNLEGAKKNLEGILSQIPPPSQWSQYTKHVYEYHYHHYNHDPKFCARPFCPCHNPVYVGPWWQYYGGNGYITYPAQSRLIFPANPSVSINTTTLNPLISAQGGGMYVSGKGVDVITTVPALPNSTVVTKSVKGDGSPVSFVSHNSNLPFLNNVSLASSSFATRADASGSISFTGTVNNAAPVEYTKNDAAYAEAVTALQAVGFFDMGAPPVDAADLSVADLAKTALK